MRRKVSPVLRHGGLSLAAFKWYRTVPKCSCGKYLISYERRRVGMCVNCQWEYDNAYELETYQNGRTSDTKSA